MSSIGAAADDAGTVIAAALETSPSVQVDLSALTSIDADGACTLVALYKRSRSMGKILSFFPGPPNVQKVFETVSSMQPSPFWQPDPSGLSR